MNTRLYSLTGRAAFALAILALVASDARAGIVNVQSSLATEPEPGVSGSVTGAVDWRTGNFTRLLFSLAPVMRFHSGDHSVIAMASVDYFRDSELLRVFEHVRYRHSITDRLLGETFVQHERNDKRLLGIRAVAGLGARYQIVDTKRLQVGLGAAYMFEYERLQDQGEDFALVAPETRESRNHRLSSYLTCSYEMADNLQLVQTLYAQPLMSDLNDVRLHSDSALVIKVTKSISFKTTLTMAYDSKAPEYEYVGAPPVPPDVEPTPPNVKAFDSVFKSAITYDF